MKFIGYDARFCIMRLLRFLSSPCMFILMAFCAANNASLIPSSLRIPLTIPFSIAAILQYLITGSGCARRRLDLITVNTAVGHYQFVLIPSLPLPNRSKGGWWISPCVQSMISGQSGAGNFRSKSLQSRCPWYILTWTLNRAVCPWAVRLCKMMLNHSLFGRLSEPWRCKMWCCIGEQPFHGFECGDQLAKKRDGSVTIWGAIWS